MVVKWVCAAFAGLRAVLCRDRSGRSGGEGRLAARNALGNKHAQDRCGSARGAHQRLAALHVEGRGRANDKARDAVRAHDLVGGERCADAARSQLRAHGRRRDDEVDALRVGRVRGGPDLHAKIGRDGARVGGAARNGG